MATWHFDTNIKISENKWRRVRVLATPTSEWSSSMMTSWALYRRKARPRQVSGRSGGRQEVGVSKTRLHRASLLSSSFFFFTNSNFVSQFMRGVLFSFTSVLCPVTASLLTKVNYFFFSEIWFIHDLFTFVKKKKHLKLLLEYFSKKLNKNSNNYANELVFSEI